MNENKKYYVSPDLTLAYLRTSNAILTRSTMSKEESDDDDSYGEYVPIPGSSGNY